jgi:hypothetical protein
MRIRPTGPTGSTPRSHGPRRGFAKPRNGARRARRRSGRGPRSRRRSCRARSRARESQAIEESARAREEALEDRRELARARTEVESLRASDAISEAQRARGEARDLAGKVGSLESRVERLRERERELENEVERSRAARSDPAPEPRGERAAPVVDETDGAEAETWLFPVYTREFYDSIEGWDRRIQRAAFKQAHLLALDHRHPSLRALPLEGLPGYYRVRVATLIDREDLDRYIRQAKTRG